MSKSRRIGLRILLVGADGRMGQAIQAAARMLSKSEIVGRVQSPKDWAGISPEQVDVVIDFSSPKGLSEALSWCLKYNRPLVSGTTGITAALKSKLRKGSRRIPVLYSVNMSLGIAAMCKMISQLKMLENWGVHIHEIHHKMKRDRPSGTALLLKDQVIKTLGKKRIKVTSARIGKHPGTHIITMKDESEAVSLEHVAKDRKIFALGALRAARWLFDKARPGFYDLTDLY